MKRVKKITLNFNNTANLITIATTDTTSSTKATGDTKAYSFSNHTAIIG